MIAVLCLCSICRVEREEELGDGEGDEAGEKKEDDGEREEKCKSERERRKGSGMSSEGLTELLGLCLRCDPFEK